MAKAEFLLSLPDGRLVSYEQILSPFNIYTITSHPQLYLLIPKSNQEHLNGIIVIASEIGIRICRHKGWPQMLVSKLHNLQDCEHNDSIKRAMRYNIPQDVQYSICSELIKVIQYK